jgi:hypothetical protein
MYRSGDEIVRSAYVTILRVDEKTYTMQSKNITDIGTEIARYDKALTMGNFTAREVRFLQNAPIRNRPPDCRMQNAVSARSHHRRQYSLISILATKVATVKT